MIEIPKEVIEWVREAFAGCNRRVSEKLTRNPNAPEESFDLSWIESLDQYSTPVRLGSGWLVAIESHFLGGMRHFGSWEIADIGILVYVRFGSERTNKVALLQSKRLFPQGKPVRVQTRSDFESGFVRLADPENESLSIGLQSEYRFDESSGYEALRSGSGQMQAIEGHEAQGGPKVYYQLYNPWTVPLAQVVPLVDYTALEGSPELGVRIVPAARLHGILEKNGAARPKLADLEQISPLPPAGWRLEQFVCDELLACHEGDRFDSIDDEPMFNLFNRRSGPIAASIAIMIEAPAGVAE